MTTANPTSSPATVAPDTAAGPVSTDLDWSTSVLAQTLLSPLTKRRLSPGAVAEPPKRIKGMLGITLTENVLDGVDTPMEFTDDPATTPPANNDQRRVSLVAIIPADACVIDLTDD